MLVRFTRFNSDRVSYLDRKLIDCLLILVKWKVVMLKIFQDDIFKQAFLITTPQFCNFGKIRKKGSSILGYRIFSRIHLPESLFPDAHFPKFFSQEPILQTAYYIGFSFSFSFKIFLVNFHPTLSNLFQLCSMNKMR